MKIETKFRIWDKKRKKMYYQIIISEPDPDIYMVKNKTIELNQLLKDLQQNDVLLQFTGLKDENGKEIYSGDIVKTKKGTYEMEWLEADGFYFHRGEPHNEYISLGDAEGLGKLEVIGNIYENRNCR